jgi:signal transduction histidine kinase/ActR/RegA family two-component response regulator
VSYDARRASGAQRALFPVLLLSLWCHKQDSFPRICDSVETAGHMPPSLPLSTSSEARFAGNRRGQEILSAQVHLLYANANLGVCVTLLAATVLALLEWESISHSVVAGWWIYMTSASVLRYVVARQFRRASPEPAEVDKWRTAYAICAGLAGAGWGAAGILLYQEEHLPNQVLLVFVLGGMMLGSASVLAARPEAFLAFLIPAGLGPTIRLLLHGDTTHLGMGALAGAFTVAIILTTRRIHRTVDSSLRLQFENRDLVEELQGAKDQTEALNAVLEVKVEERTAELQASTEQLRAEIAQREQMEEELLRGRKLESLGVLAGGIAHDFNNFLTVVQGNIELIKSQLDDEEPVQQTLDETADACRRAALLSSRLLTFAKGGAPVRRVVSLTGLVMDAVHLARAGTSTHIVTRIAEDLRPAEVDPDQIVQVLHNILLNARQSMPEGGTIEVRGENIAAEDHPHRVPRIRIAIRDHGCGIPPEILPRIFDPYFTTKPNGSGLGLATAYAIVTKHGGHITVDSKPGDGTVFSIELPASENAPSAPADPAAPAYGGSGRLLVMDDDQSVLRLQKSVLSRLGYDVQTASEGSEAIALYREAKQAGAGFDAVLLDLTIRGGMGGMETAARLKELDPTAKLIVASGYSDAPVMADFAAHGFSAALPKPSTISEISHVLRQVLNPNNEHQAE